MLAIGQTSRNVNTRYSFVHRKRSIIKTIVRAVATTAAATTSGVSCSAFVLGNYYNHPSTVRLNLNLSINKFSVNRSHSLVSTSLATTANSERYRKMLKDINGYRKILRDIEN